MEISESEIVSVAHFEEPIEYLYVTKEFAGMFVFQVITYSPSLTSEAFILLEYILFDFVVELSELDEVLIFETVFITGLTIEPIALLTVSSIEFEPEELCVEDC